MTHEDTSNTGSSSISSFSSVGDSPLSREYEMIPDIVGTFLGGASVVLLYLLYKYSDDLSDGNVGGDEKE